jgi:hypothetical protein
MAISDTQKVDYLWKKIGYGVAKSDTDANKKAYEEAIASPLLLRGDRIWQLSGSIPGTIPATTTSPVTVYKDGTGSWSHTVECTEDTTASDNRTWKTNLTDWIPVEFGATYQVQIYIDVAGASNPQTTGTKIFAAGSGNNDEWYFDYQSGVLNFIGSAIPSSIASPNITNRIFVSGARYTGTLGFGQSDSSNITNATIANANITNANLGNINIQNNTISSIDTNGNIILDPNGTGNVKIYANLLLDNGLLANLGNLALANYINVANNLKVSGDANIVGNLTVLGAVSYIQTTTTYVTDPITELGGGNAGAILSSNDNMDRGSLLHYYTNTPVDAFIGWDNSNAEFAIAGNVTVLNNVVSYNDFGNVRLGNIFAGNVVNAIFFTGDGGLLSNIQATGGSAGTANTANTVTANAQPNITSVGNLLNLTVGTSTPNVYINGSGNVTIGGDLSVLGNANLITLLVGNTVSNEI